MGAVRQLFTLLLVMLVGVPEKARRQSFREPALPQDCGGGFHKADFKFPSA